jgi:hypothetical protein
VIDGALKALSEGYIFPDVAKQMEQAIRARQQRKEYDSITNARLLARTLTDHLRDVSHDKHLFVEYVAQVSPPQPPLPTPEQRRASMRALVDRRTEVSIEGCASRINDFQVRRPHHGAR